MKRRLRKKKHVGEYTAWGRGLVVTRRTSADSEAFHDAFILEAMEANGCYCGGALTGDGVDVVVELGTDAKTPGPSERFARIVAWLEARPDVARWRASEPVDLWHGEEELLDTAATDGPA